MEARPAETNSLDYLLSVEIPAAKPIGPVQAIAPISKQPLAWLATSPGETRKTAADEEREYFSGALFTDVFDARPGPNDVQQIEIFDRAALVDFFPSFENSAFADLALENCSLIYYPREVGLSKPGLYFQTDIVLGGLLDSVLECFKMFLSESQIVIRLSAFLGFTLERNEPFHFDKLVLSGCLGGLKVCYPPGAKLLEVVSAGVRISFSNMKKEETSGKREREPDTAGPPLKRQKQSGDVGSSKYQGTAEKTASSRLPSSSNQQKTPASTMPGLLELADPQKLASVGSAALTKPSGPVTTDARNRLAATNKEGKSTFPSRYLVICYSISRLDPLCLFSLSIPLSTLRKMSILTWFCLKTRPG